MGASRRQYRLSLREEGHPALVYSGVSLKRMRGIARRMSVGWRVGFALSRSEPLMLLARWQRLAGRHVWPVAKEEKYFLHLASHGTLRRGWLVRRGGEGEPRGRLGKRVRFADVLPGGGVRWPRAIHRRGTRLHGLRCRTMSRLA